MFGGGGGSGGASDEVHMAGVKERVHPNAPSFTWKSHNEISFSDTKRDGSDPHSVLLLRWSAQLVESRKLVCEGHSNFLSLQRRVNDCAPGSLELAGEVRRVSCHYRAVLKAAVLHLQTALEKGKGMYGERPLSESERESYIKQSQEFAAAETIWHLCELFHIYPTQNIGPQLVDWLVVHFPEEANLGQFEGESYPENHPDYWTTLYRFVLRGKMSMARDLLELHSECTGGRNELYALTAELLTKMPRLYAGYSIAEFLPNWKLWRNDCSILMDTRAELRDGDDAHLTTLYRLLCGDEDSLIDMTHTWCDLLVAHVLFTDPTIQGVDVRFLLDDCLSQYGGIDQMTPFDRVLIAIVKKDVVTALRSSVELLDNWWLAAHLGDILTHCGGLPTYPLESGCGLREHLLLEYAWSLASNQSDWQLSVSYLSSCPKFGREHMKELILRQPIDSDHKAHKLLSVCRKYALDHEAIVIQKVVGSRKLQSSQPGHAIGWFVRARHAGLLDQVANRVLNDYLDSGSVEGIEGVVENIAVADFEFSGRLLFLRDYHRLQLLWRAHDHAQVARLTVSLIESRRAPRQFWLPLLLDCVPLLEASPVVFSSSDTYVLMHALQAVLSSHRRKEFIGNTSSSCIQSLQIALTHNLSRATVQRHSSAAMGVVVVAGV